MPELSPAAVAVSAGTPYVTPEMLLAAPTGVVWSSLGPGPRPTPLQQFDEQVNLTRRATSMIDGYCCQPLRATVDVEDLYGPGDMRFQLVPSGAARLLLSRSPVTMVLGGQICAAASFPPNWSPIPATSFKIEKPLIGVYGTTVPGGSDNAGQAVLLAPGIATWRGGRGGWQVQVAYVNGWPHGSLQAPAAAGDQVVSVDDCTGWCPLPSGSQPIPHLAHLTSSGAAGTVYDPGKQEIFTTLAASATSGPGMLTLAAPLAMDHGVGVMVSTLPSSVIQAAILYCVSQALIRGATATSIQATSGGAGGSGGAGAGIDHAGEAELLIHAYKRVI
jgi:hypothetical protein